MQIHFTKNNGKLHLITYYRTDGTNTWMHASEYFVLHDLSHYAIESELCYPDAFYGMLNQGMKPGDFENRQIRQQLGMSSPAAHAENLANLFLTEQLQGRFNDFISVAEAAWKTSFGDIPSPALRGEQVDAIRQNLEQRILEWKNLEIGNTLILSFST